MGDNPYFVRAKISCASLITANELKHLAAISYLADRTWRGTDIEINRCAYLKTCANVGEPAFTSVLSTSDDCWHRSRNIIAYSPRKAPITHFQRNASEEDTNDTNRTGIHHVVNRAA